MTTTSASPAAGADGSGVRPGSSRMSQKQRTPSDGTDSSSCGATREPWISTNKILNSSLCGRRINSRNPNFDYDETKLLIALWGDPAVQKTLITTHKKHPVIAELARKMRDHGYNRSTEEINTRIKNLKCFYNRIKKDMAAGVINQTTWRHYAEMDEIISRPVFGNAHRLHLQQQQLVPAKQQHPAKHETEADESAKDPPPQFPVKLEVMSDDDDEDEYDEATEIRAEDLLTIDTHFPEDAGPAVPGGNAVGAIRPRRGGRNGRGAGGRNERKQPDEDDDEEDEDDDDEYDDDDEGSDFDVENEFNDGLDELLQKAQATKTTPVVTTCSSVSKPAQGLTTTTTPAKAANASGLVIETITSGNGTTITAAAGSAPSNPPTGKISVVPTNLLMKQPSSVASSLATPIQLYTQPTVSIAKGVVPGGTTTMVATGGPAVSGAGGAPMKLLLVNTVAKDGTTQQILTPATDGGTGLPKLIPAPGIQHSTIPLSVTGGPTPIVTIPTMSVPKRVGEPAKPSTPGIPLRSGGGQSAGFRTLLTQLVAIQRENLALNQERLALEKERLQYEKQFGGSLVSMVRNMSTFFSGMLQHQRKEQQQNAPQQQTQEPSGKTVEQAKKSVDGAPSPSTVLPDNATSRDVREISSSPSPSSSSSTSTSRVASPTSTTKVPTANDSGSEAKRGEPKAGVKRTEPSSSPPPPSPALSVKPSSTSDVSILPKKRRMMTRNSANHAQAAAENGSAEDALKTEVISDAEEHARADGRSSKANAAGAKVPRADLLPRHTLGGRRRLQQKFPKMWVSTNKVLIGSVGGLKKAHCRNPNFDCEETKLLISLWGDPQVQRTLITTHKKHPVIAKLAEKMRDYGYNRSTEEINTRIKNLKCFYNRIKKDLETGVINEPSWKHFQAMDEILTRPVFGGANAASRYQPTPLPSSGAAGTSGTNATGSRQTHRALSAGSSGPDLSELDADHIAVKLELVSDDEKELRPEELLKNAEQVELKEPNLLIPKDEPMEDEEDDPNDPDFEDDGGSETDDESSGMDEADESERSTRTRRRTRRAQKPKKSISATTGPAITESTGGNVPTIVSTAPTVPGTIKIINYAGKATNLNLSSVANVVSAVPSASATLGVTTLASRSDVKTTSSTTTTASKISLVPTNFLLKPQAPNIGFKQPIQLYTKPTVSIATTKPTPGLQPIVSVSASGGVTTTTGTGTPGAPMKVFLVNTLSKDGTAQKQQLISPATKQIYTTSSGVSLQGTSHVSGLPQISIQPKQLLTSTGATTLGGKFLQSAATVTPRPAAVVGTAPPKFGGFKTLLSQLVGLQRENLGITRTRLVAEKERLSNEKSVGNALLDALGDLNALLTQVNATLPEVKHSDEDPVKMSTDDSPISSPRRDTNRNRPTCAAMESPSMDDDSVKAELISDSEDG
uniref:Myb/SANT-like DNA-binding domain-containing protein n=1 Tax=Anopheles dirus TaxID=7168 RepID=A0A182MXB0_9DIPT